MKIRIKTALAACFLAFVSVSSTAAEVRTTKEGTGNAEEIYVAGNPDWYPVEFYNKETGCYEGIFPEILKLVGEKTGYDFVYVRAGTEDERLRLAQNGQVEILSGYEIEEEELEQYGMTTSRVMVSYIQDDEPSMACLAYTAIAEKSLIQSVNEALGEITDSEVLGMAVRYTEHDRKRKIPLWAALAAGGAILGLSLYLYGLKKKMREEQERAEKERLFDPVTGLGNRSYFTRYFETYLSDQYRAAYCLVYIGFQLEKANEYYGKDGVESQIRYGANELLKSASDTDIVARVSENGLAAVHLCSSEEQAKRQVEELLVRLNRYHEEFEKDFRVEFRAGIYMMEQLDRDAETCLYNAQQGYEYALVHKQAYAFAYASMIQKNYQKAQLRAQVFDGIRQKEFRMFLQFVVSAQTGEVKGAEALSRWDHPQKGMLYPGSYLEMMEDEKIVSHLDFYIFEEVCRLAKEWQEKGHRMRISCNFTWLTIAQEDFISRIKEITDRFSLDCSGVILEIGEMLDTDRQLAFENISRCREMGFSIAMDDMGYGYTSFADLRDYPIDIVKIDRSILQSATSERGTALLKGMTALAHSLGMEVLCEGIETSEQAELVKTIGCEYMQGFYFYRAMPEEEAERILDTI